MALLLTVITSLTMFGLARTPPGQQDATPLIVAVAAQRPQITSEVCSRFGQSPYFMIVDVRSNHIKSVLRSDPHQTGYDLANKLTKLKVNVVIVGKIGPNALEALHAAELRMIQGFSGTVEEALTQFEAGDLR